LAQFCKDLSGLMNFLTALDRDVDIVIRCLQAMRTGGRIVVTPA
jgi:hypothetical protein